MSEMSSSTASEKSSQEYRRGGTEKFLLRALWDIFVAPVLAALSTAALFSFHLMALFVTASAGFLISMFAFNRTALIDDFDVEMNIALGISTVSAMLLCAILPASGSASLSVFVGLSSSILGLLSLRLNSIPVYGVGLVCGLGAALGALLFWTQIEDERRSIGMVLSRSYANLSALNQKPRDNAK